MSRIYEALQRSAVDVRVGVPQNSTLGAEVPDVIAQLDHDANPPRGGATFTLPTSPEKRLVAVTDRLCLGAEKLRMLSARLKYLQQRRPMKKLLVTSTIRGEGKTTISANLGVVLAQQRQKVLLIDGDFHQPGLSALLGLTVQPGLGDWWRQQQQIGAFLRPAEGLPLWFLGPGAAVDQPLTMLHSPEVAQLIESISSWFDWVIIDSPPLAPLADASVWSTMADSILLVCRQGITPKRMLEQHIGLLDKAKILGVVHNDADSTEQRYYRDYYKRHPAARPQAIPHQQVQAAPRQKV